eukprot:756534-Hanusia_phi.AAC.1
MPIVTARLRPPGGGPRGAAAAPGPGDSEAHSEPGVKPDGSRAGATLRSGAVGAWRLRDEIYLGQHHLAFSIWAILART